MFFEIFYVFLFVLTLASAIMVVVSPHAVYSALYLVLTMIGVACLFVMMNAMLAAAFQIIVYAGAIVVLFLFTIMLLNLGRQTPHRGRHAVTRWLGLALSIALVAQVGGAMLLLRDALPAGNLPTELVPVPVPQVALFVITEYLYAFEMISVLLLVAVIGSVVLARRRLVQGIEVISDPVQDRGADRKEPATWS